MRLLITEQVLIPRLNNPPHLPSVTRKFPKLELACKRRSLLRALELLTAQSETSRDGGGEGAIFCLQCSLKPNTSLEKRKGLNNMNTRQSFKHGTAILCLVEVCCNRESDGSKQTRQVTYIWRNIEVRSRSYYCCGKAIMIAYF